MVSAVAYKWDLKQAVTEKATLRNTYEGRAANPSCSLKSWSLSVASTEYTALQICGDMKWGFTGCIAHVDHLRLHQYANESTASDGVHWEFLQGDGEDSPLAWRLNPRGWYNTINRGFSTAGRVWDTKLRPHLCRDLTFKSDAPESHVNVVFSIWNLRQLLSIITLFACVSEVWIRRLCPAPPSLQGESLFVFFPGMHIQTEYRCSRGTYAIVLHTLLGTQQVLPGCTPPRWTCQPSPRRASSCRTQHGASASSERFTSTLQTSEQPGHCAANATLGGSRWLGLRKMHMKTNSWCIGTSV